MTKDSERPPRNVTAVGGVVIGSEGMLLVRMAYGPTKGRYMIPGGHVDSGETLDKAVVREVLEETGVTAQIRGVCAVRTRHDGPNNDTYVLFLMDPVGGEPVSDGKENEDARYFSLEELDREDVTDLSAYFGRLAMNGELQVMALSDDVDWARAGRDTKSWKLFR